MIAAPDRPFTHAAMGWFEEATDLHNVITTEPCEGSDAINLYFSIGGGAIQGYAYLAGISVAAMWKGECYDLLFDEDIVSNRGPEGWCCSLCSAGYRRHFSTIEALWRDHLLESLRRWIRDELLSSVALELYRREGLTWARLAAENEKTDGQCLSISLSSDR
ncbi:hypothetical protein [Sphingobium sp. DN12]|uniref:hypothetical protein n=1 Tax=Sphingobium sp. DN12 TaxID=3378073 RepID=UPI003DA2AEF1